VCDYLFHPLKCTVGSVADGVVGQIASAVQTAEADIIGSLSSIWVDVPTPTLGSTETGKPLGAVAFLWQYTSWFVAFFAVLGLLIAAGKLAWQRRGEPARAALYGLFNLIVVSGCSVAAVEIASKASDYYSTWVLYKALDLNVDPGQTMTATGASQFSTAVKNLAVLSQGQLADMLIIVMGLLGIISSIIQMILMLVRYAMLGLLTGMLPVTASISGTQSGQATFKKALGWLLAFILYKPVAATVYAYAIVSMKQDSVTSVMAGLAMIIMAVAALPALMRFIVPAVSPTTGGGGGAGAALAGAGIATGARMLASRSGAGSGGGGGGGGPDSPSPSGGPTGSNNASTSGGGKGQGGEGPTGGGDAPSPNGGGGETGAQSGAEGAAATTGGAGSGAGAGAGAGAGGAGAGASGAGAGAAGAGGAAAAGAGPAGLVAAAAVDKVNQAKDAAKGAVEGSAGEGPSGSQ
jgi:type IV secretion system protein TrbL